MSVLVIGAAGFALHQYSVYRATPPRPKQTIIDKLSDALHQQFKAVDTWGCAGGLYTVSCPPGPKGTIAVMTSSANAPARRVAGYNFFVMPYQKANDTATTELDIDTQEETTSRAVKQFLIEQLTKQYGFTTKTKALQSEAEPSDEPDSSQQTYYSKSTLCELDISAKNMGDGGPDGRAFLFTCAPLAVYPKVAAEVKPLADVYITAHPEFAHPERTGKWLQFFVLGSQDRFVMDSKTAGYKIGMATIDDLSWADDPNGEKSGDAFFYAKGDSWHLLLDRQFSIGIPCSYAFPNADTHRAYVGAKCAMPDSSTQLIQ